MTSQLKVRTTFEPTRVIQPIFTRGEIALTQDGQILASCLDDETLLTDLETGTELARIEGVSASKPNCALQC
jgi:U3 small nucleolar RNA-associated protein 13